MRIQRQMRACIGRLFARRAVRERRGCEGAEFDFGVVFSGVLSLAGAFAVLASARAEAEAVERRLRVDVELDRLLLGGGGRGKGVRGVLLVSPEC